MAVFDFTSLQKFRGRFCCSIRICCYATIDFLGIFSFQYNSRPSIIRWYGDDYRVWIIHRMARNSSKTECLRTIIGNTPFSALKFFYNLVFSHSKSQSRRDLLMLGLLGGVSSSTLTYKIIFAKDKNVLADNSFSPIIV